MLTEPKTITLKNGGSAILRNPAQEDAAELLACITTCCGETDFLARTQEEWASATVESEERWIEAMRSGPAVLSLLCTVEGKIAGNCEIRFLTGVKTAHRAVVGISILKEYWGLGIGSAMFEALLTAAKDHGSELVELEFLQGNDRAKALYEKFGFAVVCEKPNAYKLPSGEYRSEFTMQKYL